MPQFILLTFVLCVSAGAHAQEATPASPLQFTVSYDPSIAASYTGRVYVMLSGGFADPRFGPSWQNTQPFYAVDVRDWKPDTPLVINDENVIGFPGRLADISEREYGIQAVIRRNPDSPAIGSAAGSAFSDVFRAKINAASGNIELRINAIEPGRGFRETDRIKLVEMKSELLSTFHGRDISMRAAVILPEKYSEQPMRKYPALYWIGGFGSDHHAAPFVQRQWDQTGMSQAIVRIVLDPQCWGGHHVFADSDNNGPRGRALVEEFIPHLERVVRLVPSPTARFLSGHSSGGWSSLWLQIMHPDFFGGAWSIAPDPVDFRDFQRINLYQPGANMYRDEQGKPRPLGRQGDRVIMWYEPFAKMEVVYGEGGQLRSFEWVFSRRGSDGLPEPLYDRNSGAVNASVAESWKRYDIRLVLEENWQTLGPKLDGGSEIRVFMGELDTFYLEGATKLLRDSQRRLGSKAVIEIVPGKDHGSIASPELRLRIDRELLQIFNHNNPEHARPIAYD